MNYLALTLTIAIISVAVLVRIIVVGDNGIWRMLRHKAVVAA